MMPMKTLWNTKELPALFGKGLLGLSLLGLVFVNSVQAQETAPQVEETSVVKENYPFSISGSLTVHPLAYDYNDFYVGIQPKVGLVTRMHAPGGRTFVMEMSYDFLYRGFYTNDTQPSGEAHFKNNFELMPSMELSDKFSSSGYFDAEYLNVRKSRGEQEIFVLAEPQINYQIIPTTTLFVGYSFLYDYYPENPVSPGEINAGPRSDPDDGGIIGVLGNSNSVGAFGQDFFGAALDSGSSTPFFVARNSVFMGVNHSFDDTVNGSFTYRFGRFISSNDDSEVYENWIQAKIGKSQIFNRMSLNVMYRLRAFDFIYGKASDGITGRLDFRQRFYVMSNVTISNHFGWGFHYRAQKNSSNNDAADSLTHQLWTGLTASF